MARRFPQDFDPLVTIDGATRLLAVNGSGESTTDGTITIDDLIAEMNAVYATAAQGAKADTALQPAAIGVTLQGYSLNLASWASVSPSAYSNTTTMNAAINAAIAGLVDTAPDALNTLNELAAALADDANFAATVTAALADKQPLDSDLSAIAGLSTTSYGRALLTVADLNALRAILGPSGTPSNSTFLRGDGQWATPAGGGGGDLLASNNLSDLANAATARTNLSLVPGTHVQVYSANLSTFAGINPSANVQSMLGAANYAGIRALLDVEAGVDYLTPTVLASVSNGQGASLIGIEDAGSYYSGTTVEAALAYLGSRIADLDASVVLRGDWDASSGSFPGGGTAQAGSSYIVSVAGTVNAVAFNVGDRIIAITDNASTSTFAANWFKADYTDLVSSVAGRTGAVTLAVADLTDMSANARSFNQAANFGAMRTAISLVPGTDVQVHSAQLAAIAALSPSNDDILQRKSGAWTNRTMAQLIADLAALGTTFQPLDSDLTAIAALSTTSFGRSALTVADAAALATLAGVGTGNSPQFTGIELGHATQNTLTAASGVLSIEGAALAFREPGYNAQTGTTYTFVLADAGKIVSGDNGSAQLFTIPTNASVAFPLNTIINVPQLGAGVLSIKGDTGVTLNGVSGGTGAISARYSAASLWKVATNTWLLMGNVGTVA